MLSGQLLRHMPRPLAIEFVRTTFPDCKAIALDGEIDEPIWIEFELLASHYSQHLRRHEHCDWIVCWENDVGNAPRRGWPTIVVLDEIVRRLPGQYIANPRPPNMSDVEYFQLRVATLTRQHQFAIGRFLDFAATPNLGLHVYWPRTNGGSSTVLQGSLELLKVSANGKVGTRFYRWRNRVSAATISEVVAGLNRVLGKTWFRASGKLGADIVQAMPDDATVAAFVGVWLDFARANLALQPTALLRP